MILIINICKEKLHYFEFVKPVEDILKNNEIKFFTKHYSKINSHDVDGADHLIICGTSLADNDFIKNVEKFSWMKKTNKPILGICGGMQVIGILFGGELNEKTEIGFYREMFKESFLGLKGEQEVYHLHNNYVDFSEEFLVYSSGNGVSSISGSENKKKIAEPEISQAVKHREKEIYGILFHPEVRQKDLILNFSRS